MAAPLFIKRDGLRSAAKSVNEFTSPLLTLRQTAGVNCSKLLIFKGFLF